MSCSCIFWHVEYIKTIWSDTTHYIVYFTTGFLYKDTNFNQFLHIMTRMQKNWFLVVFFGSVQSIGVLGQLKTSCGCWSVQIGLKNQTEPDP